MSVDLNGQSVLFTIFVSLKNVKDIFSIIIDEKEVVPNRRPVEMLMLSTIFGAPGNTGARLIELSASYSNIGAVVVKDFLSPNDDLELIHRYKPCGMDR